MIFGRARLALALTVLGLASGARAAIAAPTMAPTMVPTMVPTMAPTMAPTMVPTMVDVPLVDPALALPVTLSFDAGGAAAPIELPFAVDLPGGPYRAVRVLRDGALELLTALPLARRLPVAVNGAVDAAAGPPSSRLRLDVLAGPVGLGRQGKVVIKIQPSGVLVRWVDVEVATGKGAGRAVFEVMVHASGGVRFQHYALPRDLARSYRVGWTGPGGGEALGRPPVAGTALELDLRAPPPGDASVAVSCASCPATENIWLRELVSPGKVCAPSWDGNGDGVPDTTGCSCNVPGSSCLLNCGLGPAPFGVLRSTPLTTVDTRWQFDEADYCKDCVYRFYVLVECGTEMHLPLKDMEGVRLQITEVFSGLPVPITCENQAHKAPGSVFVDACPAPTTTRYLYPSWQGDNAADPAVPVEWGFADGCLNFGDLDADGDGAIECGTELPVNPGGTLELATILPGFSPGEDQVMDCRVGSAVGLCGLYRLDINSGGFFWELFSNCTGDDLENFRIFDSCAAACAAFNPLPELTVSNAVVAGCSAGVDVSFDLTNIGCADATPLDYQIETSCPVPDVVTGTAPGTLAANTTRTVADRIPTVSCAPPFNVTIRIDPSNRLAECSESPSAAKCNAIPGQTSVTVPACACVAVVTARLTSSAPGWCVGSPPPTLSAGTSSSTGCASGVLEYRWWKDAVGAGSPLTPWQTASDYTPGAEAVDGANSYAVEVRCQGETCAQAATLAVTRNPKPAVDPGRDRSICLGQSVVLGGAPTGSGGTGPYTYLWTSNPAGQIAAGEQTLANPNTVALTSITAFTVEVTDAAGCKSMSSVLIDVATPSLPLSTGNTLRQIKDRATASVRLGWTTSDPFTVSFRIHRGTAKAPPYAPLPPDTTGTTFVDAGVLFDGRLYFYGIHGLNCAGAEGP